jgi:glycosyltransferase involved in cell wall biosynthesis
MAVPGLHVALNATFLDPGVSGGTETYIRGLIPALHAARPEARLTILTSRRAAAAFVAEGWQDIAEIVAMPCDEGERGARLLTEIAGVPHWVRRHRPSLLHNLANLGPVTRVAVPQVLTLHDLIFMRLPTFSRLTRLAMTQVALRGARSSARIITPTRASLAELVELGDLPRELIDVIPHGRKVVVPAPPAAVDEARAQFDLAGRRVVLCVAAKRPHKNQELLVRALASLPEDVVVVLAGHAEPYAEHLVALAQELGVTARLRMPDYVTDEQLEALWQLADVAAFPTRGEGFGLPVIEAFDRGVAVACSSIDVLTEVSGGLAHPFDPDDPGGAAAAILAGLSEPADEAAKRRAHAARFSWQTSAEQHWDSYERALFPTR